MYIIVSVFFSFWVLLTIAFQLPSKYLKSLKWLPYLDLFSLIPRWTFFAPNPGQSDYNLLYREIWHNECQSNWREVNIGLGHNSHRYLFNPKKRISKAIFDLTSSIVKDSYAYNKKPEFITISLPYIIILNYITYKENSPYANAIQFVIIESFGFHPKHEPKLILTSSTHRLC